MRTSTSFLRIAAILPVMALVIMQSLFAQDRRTDKTRLTIMSFNAEFMWDGVAPEQGNVDFAWKNSQTEAEDRMEKIAEIIIHSNPDIINMVEIENLTSLQTLNQKFLAGRGYIAYLVEGRDSYTGQDVGLLTRVDPEGGNVTPDFRNGMSGGITKSVSKNYNARFNVSGTKIALIGLHFLAQPGNEGRRFERQAQADAVRSMALDHLAAGYAPIVLGDFNDYDGEDCCKDHISSMPISFVLTSLKAMNPLVADDDLVNVSSFVPQSLRYTAHWDRNDNEHVDFPNEYTSIDHILISNKLVNKVERVDMPHNHDPLAVTDHFPVVVTLTMSTGGGSGTGPRVVISGLLPNPPGNDNDNEEITVKNLGNQSATLTGWKVRDIAGKTWNLDAVGTLAAGQEKSIKRSGQPMALNNDGDTIELLDATNAVVHSVSYGSVDEGEWVTPGQ